MENKIKYNFLVFCYHLRYNVIAKIIRPFKMFYLSFYLRKRLKKYSDEKSLNVAYRYSKMKRFKRELETRITYNSLNEMIASISDKTGVPQWQLRAQVNKDFNLDI